MIKLSKLALISAIVLGGLYSTTVSVSANTVDGKADVEFLPADPTKPVDPTDPEDPDPKPVKPVDPEDPNPPVYPGGALRLNHIPTFQFGKNNIVSGDGNFKAYFETVIDDETNVKTKKASYVEVADETGSSKGWTVTVNSDGVFKSAKGNINAGITLTNASVRGILGMETKPEVAPTTQETIQIGYESLGNAEVMKADAGKGYNKWQVRWGHSDTAIKGDGEENRNPAVSLFVPKGQQVMADAKYTAKVVWTLQQGL
ncbi:WxL domain-containing protein [Vagococcus sp. BWB3-3]|uniref:WxL domain-containing protein n=1 Tax=Vagococcus allomyrinae TaxID=2794353 RepID=A0A940P9Q7_9ENTE|nr:WxL domain-containing protein [Vagococcus allomyrinae]MBP1040083.1 WxL domain-containing protein [Vagococcus allomyrinae]